MKRWLRSRLCLLVLLFSLNQPVNFAQDKQSDSIALTEGTPVKVIIAGEISSKTAKLGDPVTFMISEDVTVDGHVLVSRGTAAKGAVINASPAGRIGKSGKLGVAIESTVTVDGKQLKLRAAKGEEGRDRGTSTSLLAVTASYFFLLRKGSEAKVAAGTNLTAYVAEGKRFLVKGETIVSVDAAGETAILRQSARDPATVFIYRPRKIIGYADGDPSVFCDGNELVQMDNGRYVAIRLAAGKHVIHLTNKKKGFAIDMGPGQTYYFRVSMEMGMWGNHGKLTLEDAETALPEIGKLKYLGANHIQDRSLVLEKAP